MILACVGVLAGVGLLYVGAEGLVRGGAGLARRAGLSPLAIGLTVVSLGTSAPELGVSLSAALDGRGAVAVGNVLGSNVANIGLILGLAAVIAPIAVGSRVVKADLPILVAVSAALVWVLWDGEAGRIEGAALTAGLIVYLAGTLYLARRDRSIAAAALDDVPEPTKSVWLELALIVGGLALLLAGSYALVGGAVFLARAAGVSDAVIGLTVIAFGTSLPELAATGVAAAKGEGDMAVGNVVGSNLFNCLGIIGVTACVTPLSTAAAPGEAAGPELDGTLTADLLVMLAATVLLLPLVRTGFRVSRREGAVLLALYFGYVAWLFVRDGAVPAAG